jgi:hypothetical protein
VVVAVVAALFVVAAVPAVAGQPARADVANQGGGGVYATDGASLVRTRSGLSISVTIPTPPSGNYVYPVGAVAGNPEVFTAWAFIFNDPDNCTDPCNGDDLASQGAVYNLAGHANGSGGNLTLAGHIGVGQSSFNFGELTNPLGAEIHVAIAPHGALDSATLPAEFSTPAGSPFCGCWWVAVFD